MSEASDTPQADVDTLVLIQRLQAGHQDAFKDLFERDRDPPSPASFVRCRHHRTIMPAMAFHSG